VLDRASLYSCDEAVCLSYMRRCIVFNCVRYRRSLDENMTADEHLGITTTEPAPSRGRTDLVIMFLCFPLFAAAASLLGSGFVAAITGGGGMRSHLSWNKIWLSLVNGGVAGACIGLSCGLVCTVVYRLLHPGDPLIVSVDHAMDAIEVPLYWLGLVVGGVVAFATISMFRGAPIWEWRIP
jgi:ABC-type Fe3+ transport system permease subunit